MAGIFIEPKWQASAIALAAILINGCSSQSSIERYIPSDAEARAAITTAFDAWKSGTPSGPVPDTAAPLIHVTDEHRRPKEKLVSYEILGEVPGDTPRCFAVDLQYDPLRREKARFVVVGIDPLWVFRLEDYQLLAHWEHKMPPEQPAARAKP